LPCLEPYARAANPWHEKGRNRSPGLSLIWQLYA
ncbi:unnamed protein product, partial [marine sediment metagenome]